MITKPPSLIHAQNTKLSMRKIKILKFNPENREDEELFTKKKKTVIKENEKH